jgi:hypothetical protein
MEEKTRSQYTAQRQKPQPITNLKNKKNRSKKERKKKLKKVETIADEPGKQIFIFSGFKKNNENLQAKSLES